MSDAEVPLHGGVAHAGSVVRIGDTVRRPASPQSGLVQSFLTHLRAAGFDFSPEPLGWDAQGRESLGFVAGQVAHPPYDAWVWDDDLLVNVASAQRRMHRAAASFAGDSEAGWAESAGAYFPPSALDTPHLLFCHNDLGPTNVVVEAGSVVGFIDFDYVKAVDPLFDIAVAVRHWAPLGVPLPRHVTPPDLDQVRRFGRFADAHELRVDQRHRVVDLVVEFLGCAFDNVSALAAAGKPGFAALIEDGYLEANHRSREWIANHRSQLINS